MLALSPCLSTVEFVEPILDSWEGHPRTVDLHHGGVQ
jgi:hypothetical protein